MCNTYCLSWSLRNLSPDEIRGKRVLEAGAYDVNGSAQSVLKSWRPAEYIGTDIEKGPGVDLVCNAEQLVERFGADAFDTVVSNEMMEHIRDWRSVISNIKRVTRPGGIILITTRSYGFPYHAYPHDFWRYELEDMRAIFSDCEILVLESDTQEPGVLVKVRKPLSFVENNLFHYALYSIIANARVISADKAPTRTFYFGKTVLKHKIKELVLHTGKYLYERT